MHKIWVTEEIVVVSSSQKVPSVRRVKSIIQSFEVRQGRHQTISSVFRRQDVTWGSLEYKKYSREHDTASTERTGVIRTLQSEKASPHTSMTSEVQMCYDCKIHAVQLDVNCQNRAKKNTCVSGLRIEPHLQDDTTKSHETNVSQAKVMCDRCSSKTSGGHWKTHDRYVLKISSSLRTRHRMCLSIA